MEPQTIDTGAAGTCSLREAREAAGLSRHALAARAGVGTSTIERVERLAVRPRLVTRRALAAALGVTVADLWPEPYDRALSDYIATDPDAA